MKLQERKNLLVEFSKHLTKENEFLEAVIHQTSVNNPWFTKENCWQAIDSIRDNLLSKKALQEVIDHYGLTEPKNKKTIGLVLAGNIPLVGFHDIISIFLTGHKSLFKLSEKDKFLTSYFVKKIKEINPNSIVFFEETTKLHLFDAVIATGSNNSSRYFESYFGKYPNIIRKNRTSIAVLDGTEEERELKQLGKDVFTYFGLGCRNVSALYVPKGYDFEKLLTVFHDNYKRLILNSKYKNNYDYNFAMLTLNKVPFVSNGCIQLFENDTLFSRIANLHYQFYNSIEELNLNLNKKSNEIQVISCKLPLNFNRLAKFGECQKPSFRDFPDGIDVIHFLLSLN